MSVQKMRIKKNKYADTYSKNPILNSMIRRKLQGQIQHVKQTTKKLIQRQSQEFIKSNSQSRKRINSLSSLTLNKIKESLYFDPVNLQTINSQIINFVSQRQKQTPLIQQDKLKSIINARSQPERIQTKMSGNDRFSYQKIQSLQDFQNAERKIKNHIKDIDENLWIPSQPQIEQMLEQQTAKQSYFQLNRNKKSNKYHYNTSSELNRRNSGLVQYDKIQEISRPITLLGTTQKLQLQIEYQSKKYHKDDYKNLDSFLEETLKNIGLQSLLNPSDHLSKSYSVYLTVFKQFIRLTYIQCWQKGLLQEKILWSFIRLMKKIFQCQHAVNYQQFKQHSQLLKQTRNMYQDRMQKLEVLVKQLQQKQSQVDQKQRKLILAYLSYQKINQQLFIEVENKTFTVNKVKQQAKFITNKYHNLLNELVENDMIYNDDKKIYLINKYYQPEILVNLVEKGPSTIINNDFFSTKENYTKILKLYGDINIDKLKLPNLQINEEQIEYTRYGKRIKRIQNQLNKYWQKKQDDLEIKALKETLTTTRIKDTGSQHEDIIIQNKQIGVQCGEKDQKINFQQYLEKKIHEQKKFWEKRQNENKNLYISLQQLYEDNNYKISQLTSMNSQLKIQVQYLKKQNNEVNNKLMSKTAQIYTITQQLNEIIIEKQHMQQTLNNKILEVQEEINKLKNIIQDAQKKLKTQVENNQLLVRRNFDIQTKMRRASKQKDSLVQKIQKVAPWLEKFMEYVDIMQAQQQYTIQRNVIVILNDVSKNIEQYLGEFVEKDANVFSLTK